MNNRSRIAICVILVVSLSSCYSFKGSSVPPHLKTISIPLFDDQSGSGEPGLREQMTNKLIARLRDDNSFQIADRLHADALVEGIITSMTTAPIVVTGGETLQKQRLTVTAKVTYQDIKLKKKIFEKQFANYGDYDISSGTGGRTSALASALEKVTEDILNDVVSGW